MPCCFNENDKVFIGYIWLIIINLHLVLCISLDFFFNQELNKVRYYGYSFIFLNK